MATFYRDIDIISHMLRLFSFYFMCFAISTFILIINLNGMEQSPPYILPLDILDITF